MNSLTINTKNLDIKGNIEEVTYIVRKCVIKSIEIDHNREIISLNLGFESFKIKGNYEIFLEIKKSIFENEYQEENFLHIKNGEIEFFK